MLFPLLRSLCLTGIAGGLAPIIFIGIVFVLIMAVGVIPGLDEFSQSSVSRILQFLRVFGSGHSIRGVGVLAAVGGSVAMLFDTYNFLASSKPAR